MTNPKSADGRVLRAGVLFHQHPDDPTAAQAMVDEVLKESPNHAGALFESGVIAFKRAERDKKNKDAWAAAEKLFRAAAAADPGNGDALLNAARAKGWAGGTRKEVVAEFEKAAELMPGVEAPLAA